MDVGDAGREALMGEIEALVRGVGAGPITFSWCSVGDGGSESALWVKGGDGVKYGHPLPDGLGKLCWRLKKEMARPGVGTWFTMRCAIGEDGSYSVEFDFDSEPARFGAIPEHYAREMSWFPRDTEHTPDWLAAILDRVPNVYFGIAAEYDDRYEEGLGPHPGEVAAAFHRAGWSVGPGADGEYVFGNEWATLNTMSSYRMVRLAGQIPPDRWGDLVALLSGQGWKFGGEMYDGDTVTAEIKP